MHEIDDIRTSWFHQSCVPFFAALKTNSLLMVEALFWRTRQPTLLYKAITKKGHATQETIALIRKRVNHGVIGASAVTQQISSEDEADLDIDALGAGSRKAKLARPGKAAAVGKRRRAKRWTDHEEALLATKFRELVEAGFEGVCKFLRC